MSISGTDIIHHWSKRHSIDVGKVYTYTNPDFKWTVTIRRIAEHEFEFSVSHQLPSEQVFDFTTISIERGIVYAP